MAFPTISQQVVTSETGTNTTHVVNLPSAFAPGDILMVVVWGDTNANYSGWPPGWIQIVESVANTVIEIRYYVFTPAVFAIQGVERGDRDVPGTTITLTTSVARRMDAIAMSFGEPYSGLPPVGVAAINMSPSMDPPNLVYDAVAHDVLWLAFAQSTVSWAPTSYPASYTLYQQAPANGWDAMCGRELNAASENPGAFAPNPVADTGAATVGYALS